jgi:predicted DNA-binding protein with PD1-like motif
VPAWPGEANRFLAVRLSPGDDLREALSAAFEAEGGTAGFVAACVGSLSRAALRYAGREEEAIAEGPFEIVTLSGTFGPDGCHLHVAVSDQEGRMTGGHVLPGCMVRTTAEVVLGLTSAVRFGREVDAETGYAELTITSAEG